MDPVALRHAKARLVKVEEAIAKLENAPTFDAVEVAWTDFLTATATIYSKLEQGSKTSGTSTAWFGRVKKLRKTDELLCYLHHARNSEEHGIEDTAHRKAIGAEFVLPNGKRSILRFEDPNVVLKEQHEPGKVPINRIIRYTDVVRVRDRGVYYDPPTEHLGETIDTRDPVELASFALPYLQALLAEAENL